MWLGMQASDEGLKNGLTDSEFYKERDICYKHRNYCIRNLSCVR
jgi:hypothetical protein